MVITEVKKEAIVDKKKKKLLSCKNISKSVSFEKSIINKCKVGTGNITELDEHLFHEGKHKQCYRFMGAHFTIEKKNKGVRFTTWAPKAKVITVIGDFSQWKIEKKFEMEKLNDRGLWSIFIPSLENGTKYKFAITNENGNNTTLKCDPYGFQAELRPNTASILVQNKKYKWLDKKWMSKRHKQDIFDSPMNIYEVHLGSWKTKDNKFMTYKELSENIPKYIKKMGYTHVEIMPLTEHPLDGSWGYQATGYYAVTSRYGDFQDLKELINSLHQEDIGVILDWVPGHFCKDEHGLYMFDGSPTYEYQQKWRCENKGWGTANFDLGRPEVKSFLISNALYWINEFHVDGLRVDAVSNMIYLNYGRNYGEWQPNKDGGCESIEGIEFIKELNFAINEKAKGVITIAEESTSWPNVTKAIEEGGLGFTFKWNMGWMNDTLKYVELDPIYRKYHHNNLTFSMMYNYSEKFLLPISHDEVVHGKKSLLDKMWGDYWNKFAGLRLYSTYMIAHPGKKLMFMGSEFGQFIEWRDYEELEWKLIDQFKMHKNTQIFFKKLNNFYRENKALWELDYNLEGFQWIDADNKEQSILVFMRNGKDKKDTLIFICNFTPVVYYDFNIGVPNLCKYEEVFNTDNLEFGGSDQVIKEILLAEDVPWHNQPYSLKIKVPPMAALVLKKVKGK